MVPVGFLRVEDLAIILFVIGERLDERGELSKGFHG